MNISKESLNRFLYRIEIQDTELRYRHVIERIKMLLFSPTIHFNDHSFYNNSIYTRNRKIHMIEIYGISSLSEPEVNVHLEQLKLENL